jgi:HNH/ENDO VII superfamily nuclease with conserved GHE residues
LPAIYGGLKGIKGGTGNETVPTVDVSNSNASGDGSIVDSDTPPSEINSPKVNRVARLPVALRIRPKWRQSTIDYLNAHNPKDANGNFIDVKTGKPILGEKHIGHQDVSWREYQDNPANRNKTRQQVIDDYNNVSNLGYESGPDNSSNGAKTKGLENKKN